MKIIWKKDDKQSKIYETNGKVKKVTTWESGNMWDSEKKLIDWKTKNKR